jgi:beta-lactamase class A
VVFTAQPRSVYASGLESQVHALADPSQGRIGVAAIDLASGRSLAVLGDQPFPMASTSKVAIAATFLDGVDKGFYRLDEQFPLMKPVRSAKFSSAKAPVVPGETFSARYLIERSLINSDNQATDALLAVVGGPNAVNRWMRATGISGFRLDRDIATLVRDDGEYNPAHTVDPRDSTTPLAMVQFLAGLYQGRWLGQSSRSFLFATMERCATGKNRIPGQLPLEARIAHKTGSLNNTSSDIGIIQTPDGRAIAVAIYVTGQGSKPARYDRIAAIARAIYDGYQTESSGYRAVAQR